MEGIVKNGSLHKLANDLMKVALYDSGLVDSDDDLDNLDVLQDTVKKRVSRRASSRELKRASANTVELTSFAAATLSQRLSKHREEWNPEF